MRYAKPLALGGALILAGCQGQSDSARAAAGAAKTDAAKTAVARPVPKPPEPLIVPEGSVLVAKLETSLSSATSKEGDAIRALVAEDLRIGDKILLKEGTELLGRVVAARSSGRVKGRAHLAFDFDRMVVAGRERDVALRAVDITAESGKGKDAKIIGGGAGAGLILGAIVDGKKGAAIGTAVGAAAGTGAVLATKGKEVELPAGATLKLKFEKESRL